MIRFTRGQPNAKRLRREPQAEDHLREGNRPGTDRRLVRKRARRPNKPGRVRSGPKSQCDGYGDTIEKRLDEGLSIKRIHQDLISEHGFEGSYHVVHRFVRRLGQKKPVPFRRMETAKKLRSTLALEP